jgi:hypothetical protein
MTANYSKKKKDERDEASKECMDGFSTVDIETNSDNG